MKGHDYRTHTDCARPVGEWSADLADVLAAGGMRKVEDGETFAKDSRGVLLFEIYGNVQPKTTTTKRGSKS